MKRLSLALATGFAALAATAGAAFAAGPVQSGTQSSSTDQAALAASSATQVAPSNENISVRVLSPGKDGAVSQSNTASSSADASNNASPTQSASQTSASGCGCVIKSGKLGDVLGTAMQAAQAAPAAPASTTGQSNSAGSAGDAANTAPTTQSTSQSAPSGGGGGVQSSTQDASTDQTAAAASSATQIAPSNSNISVRVLSPGDNGNVTQSNEATSSADASNSANTTQDGTQNGGGSGGVQSSTQDADTDQQAAALSSAKQIKPENSNISVRVLSEGDNGSVSQSNKADSKAEAENNAPVHQTVSQDQDSSPCHCDSHGPVVQSANQESSVDQAAVAASSATQIHPSNSNQSVRIGSEGDDGRVSQENSTESSADASNNADVDQSTEQELDPSCGCSKGTAVQAAGQSSDVEQKAIGLSETKQIGAKNENAPVRIGSEGNGGSVSQENSAESSADAANNADVDQSVEQDPTGSGIQAAGQESSVDQAAVAASETTQIHPSNSNDPVRIWSEGDDGRVSQENSAESSADASNNADVDQSTEQELDPSCGCSKGPAIQAAAQSSEVEQKAIGLSEAKQIGAENENGPVRVWSEGGGGSVSQENSAESSADASNDADVDQSGEQDLSGSGIQALGQESSIEQVALAASAAKQLPGRSECGCGSSFGNSSDPVRIGSKGDDGSVSQENSAESSADASNTAEPTQRATQSQEAGCGCSGLGVQALGQSSTVGQLAAALSSTKQIGARNSSKPVRVWSWGGGGRTRQSNAADSSSEGENVARILQTGRQVMV
jgi:hypothetical protein